MSVENSTLKLKGPLQLGGGTSQTLAEINPLLRRREILIETDTNKLKIGDGNSRWNDLPYVGFASSESSGTQISSLAVPTVVLGLENAPVAIPAYGDIYIVGNTPTGAFSGATANSIAIYGENGWEFSTPTVGTKVVNIRAGKILQYNGTSWEHIASITVTNDAKCLHSLLVSDSLSTTPYIGDDWDLSTLSATAQYSTGFGNPVNSALSTPIDSSRCSFLLDGTRQIQTGQVIDISGDCNILVKYTEAGRTVSGTVSRYIHAIDNSFLLYFNTITNGSNIVLQSFNADYYNANPTQDLAVLSRTFIDGEKKNIVLSNTLFKGSTSHSVISGNLAFPDSSYSSDGTLRNWFTGISGFDANIQFPNNAQIEFDYMFYNAAYNKPVTIPNGVTNCAYAFGGSRSTFNQPVNIPNGVTNCANMFNSSSSFNSSVNIPDSVMDMSYMYYYASNFNKPVTIPNTAQNCALMFYGTSFNQDIYIPNSVNNAWEIVGTTTFNSNVQFGAGFKNFRGFFVGSGYNKPVTIPSGVTDCSYMFYYSKFNQPITIPNGVTDCSYMFNSSEFNQNLYIPDSVTSIRYMLSNVDKLQNKTIHIGNGITVSEWRYAIDGNFNCAVNMADGITDCSNMFNYLEKLNMSVKISNNATNCHSMFYQCSNFNLPVTIPSKVTDCSSMFRSCNNFNLPVTIPSKVTNCAEMFSWSNKFNQDLYIPDSVTNALGILSGCSNFKSNIHIGNGVQISNGNLQGYIKIDRTNYNGYVELGTGVTNYYGIFRYFNTFNKPINIPSIVTDCAEMFYGCKQYNCNINIPDWVTNAQNMFYDCNNFTANLYIGNGLASQISSGLKSYLGLSSSNFNGNISIGKGFTSYKMMFYSLSAFNRPVQIGDNITDCTYAFWQCSSFNQNITIPATVTRCEKMFQNCWNFGAHVFIPGNINGQNVRNMFSNVNTTSNITIHCSNANIVAYLFPSYSSQPTLTWQEGVPSAGYRYNDRYKVIHTNN